MAARLEAAHVVVRWLAVAFLWTFSLAASAQDAPLTRLDPADPDRALAPLAWFGQQPLGGIAAVSEGRLPLQSLRIDKPIPFGPGQALWLKLRLQPVAGSSENWVVEVPVPVMDRVTLYQQDASGRWFARTAGDHVPMRAWPQAGRYPYFRLQLPPGATTEIYLEVRHATSTTLPLRVVTAAAHHERVQLEYMALGLAMGALALLVLASVVRAWVLRDGAYGWYAAFSLLAMLALASFTGVAAHLLWGNSGEWVDAAPGCLTLLGASVAVLIVARLSGLFARIRWLARSMVFLGWTGLLFALLYVLAPRHTGVLLLATHLIGVAALCLYAAALTWRRGDPVGRWMLLGSVPLALSVTLALARVTGVLQPSWLTEYALVLALTFNLPMLFAALNSRSEERRSVELRRIASDSQDPLTGLMKRAPFVARLRQAVARYQRRGEGAAVAVVELSNYEWIQKTRGAEAAEEALLRAVIRLRRQVRDIDTTGRLGEHRFGLILEGVSMRRPVNAVASRLVAIGLMEEPGRPKDAVLHFHVAAVLLHERLAPADELLQSLEGVLSGMSKRTQRPFRFLDSNASPAEEEPPPDTVIEDSGMQPA
jgi:two-component system, sensor histidine kinase LadS